MNLLVGGSLNVLNAYIQKFVDRTMSLSTDTLLAIPEKDRNLVQQLAAYERDSKAGLTIRYIYSV